MKVCRLGIIAESSASKGMRFTFGNDPEHFHFPRFLKSGEESDGFEKYFLVADLHGKERFTWH